MNRKLVAMASSSGRSGAEASGGNHKRCLGTLLAHYVKHNHTKDGREEILLKGPRCYGVSWDTDPPKKRAKGAAVTLEAVERELGKVGVPLKLDWGCTGISSYTTPTTSKGRTDARRTFLPHCGGIEVILSNELEFVPDKPGASQPYLRQQERRGCGRADAPQERAHTPPSPSHPPQYVDMDDQLREVRKFCGNFVAVSNRQIAKMGENINLVATVFKKTAGEVRKAVFGDDGDK